MEPWDLREAMLNMDESVLSLDTIHKLINFVPTVEAAQQLDGYEQEKNLGVAEKFVKIVRKVDTNLVERLVLWEFKLEFIDLYRREKENLIWLKKGHDAVKQSDALKVECFPMISESQFFRVLNLSLCFAANIDSDIVDWELYEWINRQGTSIWFQISVVEPAQSFPHSRFHCHFNRISL